jgi:hypothetical protein
MAPKMRSCDCVDDAYRSRSGSATSFVFCALPAPAATAGSTFASSARRSAIVRPGASRANAVTVRIDGRVLGSSVGTGGSQKSELISKRKPGGMTPMTM